MNICVGPDDMGLRHVSDGTGLPGWDGRGCWVADWLSSRCVCFFCRTPRWCAWWTGRSTTCRWVDSSTHRQTQTRILYLIHGVDNEIASLSMLPSPAVAYRMPPASLCV